MIIFPIIPIWLMAIICIFLLGLIFKFRTKRVVLETLVIILIFVINLRIMLPLGGESTESVVNNLDVIFVVDNTLSMNAVDYNNDTRLNQVKKDCKYIVNELAGARFSLISIRNKASVSIPFVRDLSVVENAIDNMYVPNQYRASGSSIDAVEELESLLNDESDYSTEEDDSRIKVVFFMSDGEVTSSDSQIADYSSIKTLIDDGLVLGYGTEEGAKILLVDSDGNTSYLIDNTTYSGPAHSYIDEDNLNSIAKDMGVDYIRVKDTSSIKEKISVLKNGIVNKTGSKDISSYNDTYYLFLIPLFICLSLIYIDLRRSNR